MQEYPLISHTRTPEYCKHASKLIDRTTVAYKILTPEGITEDTLLYMCAVLPLNCSTVMGNTFYFTSVLFTVKKKKTFHTKKQKDSSLL